MTEQRSIPIVSLSPALGWGALVLALLLHPNLPLVAKPLAVAGCDYFNAGGSCELASTSRALLIWRDGSPPRSAQRWDGQRWLELQGERRAAGERYRVPVRASQAGLRLRFAGEHGMETHELRIVPAPDWPWLRALNAHENEAARVDLERRLASMTALERSSALFELARREYRLGDHAAGQAHLRQATTQAFKLGRLSLARRALCLLANHATSAHEFDVARAALAEAAALGEPASFTDSYGRALIMNSYGLYYAELADLNAATRAYEEAGRWVERGAEAMRGHVTNGHAFVSVQQGRLERAAQLYRSQLHSEQARDDICFRAIALSDLGWVQLEMVRAGMADAAVSGEVTQHLRLAVELFETCQATAGWRRAHARLNLAFDALRRRDLDEARAWLVRAGDFANEPRLEGYRDLLAAELALAEQQPELAYQRFAALLERATETLSWELEWRALEGSGRALCALARTQAAIARLEQAEQVLSRAVLRLPMQGARLPFLGAHGDSAQGLSAAYLSVGRADLAFAAVRRARRRHALSLLRNERHSDLQSGPAWQAAWSNLLQARSVVETLAERARRVPDDEQPRAHAQLLEQRTELQTALDRVLMLLAPQQLDDTQALRTPEPGELLLTWRRSPSGFDGYAALDDHVYHASRSALDRAADYLEPFAAAIARARKVTVLDGPAFEHIDVHRIVWRAEALIAHVPVSYSLDLPPRAAPATLGRTALVAGDAEGDLAHARREIATVSAELQSHGWTTHVLTGRALRLAAWQQASHGVRLMHYAGHARFDRHEGFGSAIALPGLELSIGDILALVEPPQHVVLSACEAAQTPEVAQATGIGLAHAFLVAGSSQVVAPTRNVQDGDAELFALELVRGLAADKPLAAAYYDALRTLRTSRVDWSAYRLIEP